MHIFDGGGGGTGGYRFRSLENDLIFKGRGLRCGSDEKMRRMWLGIEIVVVGLPPLVMLT